MAELKRVMSETNISALSSEPRLAAAWLVKKYGMRRFLRLCAARHWISERIQRKQFLKVSSPYENLRFALTTTIVPFFLVSRSIQRRLSGRPNRHVS